MDNFPLGYWWLDGFNLDSTFLLLGQKNWIRLIEIVTLLVLLLWSQ